MHITHANTVHMSHQGPSGTSIQAGDTSMTQPTPPPQQCVLEDPDMEAYLAQTTETFCELVFRVCQLIKDIGTAPVGYELVAACPPLGTEVGKNNMIGKLVLHGWDSKNATGWFMGIVQSRNLSATDLKKTPTADFVVKYTSKMTDGAINGNVACELSARTHGTKEW